jgi:NADPH:quinone reductase-like Zn-dependent oxidoreductase
VPRRIALGNFRLCGVLLNYASDSLVQTLKQAMGWNVAPRELGAHIHREIIELVRTKAVRPVVGRTAEFDELPEALEAMARRATTGRTIVTV